MRTVDLQNDVFMRAIEIYFIAVINQEEAVSIGRNHQNSWACADILYTGKVSS